jgi:hypothetical protein
VNGERFEEESFIHCRRYLINLGFPKAVTRRHKLAFNPTCNIHISQQSPSTVNPKANFPPKHTLTNKTDVLHSYVKRNFERDAKLPI